MKSLRLFNDTMTSELPHFLPSLAAKAGVLCSFASLATLGYGAPALAATITVGGGCTLADAITAANTNTATGGCVAGDAGLDTISLPTGTLNIAGPLPEFTEPITVTGAGQAATIIDFNGTNGPGLSITPSAPGSTIQDLTIRGVGGGGGQNTGANIRVRAQNTTIQRIISENSFGVDRDGAGVYFDGGNGSNNPGNFNSTPVDGSVIRDSIIQDNDNGGVTVRFGAQNVTIENNIVRVNAGAVPVNTIANFQCTANGTNRGGDADNRSDGIELVGANSITITNNLVECNGGFGIDVRTFPSSNITISNNTIRANGVGTSSANAIAEQDAGIGIRNGNNITVSQNLITANINDGIVVNDNNANASNTFTQNSIFLNGRDPTNGNPLNTAERLAIDLDAGADGGGSNVGDGVTPNDNNDGDAGANALNNFPVFEGAIISNGQLILPGFARPGSSIELFSVTTPDPNNFGEAEFFLGTLVEGGGGDLDTTTGAYSPTSANIVAAYPAATRNGLGQDNNANRFLFQLATPTLAINAPPPATLPARLNTALQIGDVVTATATFGGATSELSGLISVTAGLGVSKELLSVTPVGVNQFDVALRVRIENLSPIGLDTVQITDDLTAAFPAPATFAIAPGGAPTISNTSGAGTAATANAAFNGSTDTNLLDSTATTLAPRDLSTPTDSFIEVDFTVRVTPGANLSFENTAVGSAQIPGSGVSLTDTSNNGTVLDPGTTDPTVPANNTPTPINLGLQLIKRITQVIRGGVTTDFNTPTDNPPDPAFVGVTTPPAPNNQLSSGDTVVYTIYYLNTSGSDFTGVAICDPIPSTTSFAPDGFVAGSGISFDDPGAALGAGANQTNAPDGDQGEFLAALAANGACPGGNAGAQGGVLVNVGNVANNQRGFVRFVTTVD
ncbi:MAG: right-handed parallel beta-helix repeat-containing protein [Cyanobacteria bacterium P01_D01_bin.128]